jgi:hypothetical protein
VLDEDELEVEVDALAVAPEDEEAETPGIVSALTVPNTPTPATAAKAMPAVIWFSRDSARSRAWTLAFADFVLSMAVRVLSATQSSLRATWEGAEKLRPNQIGNLTFNRLPDAPP